MKLKIIEKGVKLNESVLSNNLLTNAEAGKVFGGSGNDCVVQSTSCGAKACGCDGACGAEGTCAGKATGLAGSIFIEERNGFSN